MPGRYLSTEWLSLVLLFLTGLPLSCRSQTTNTTCTRDDTNSWLFNSEGDSPCLVWSRLQSLCLPSDAYINVPPLFDPSYAYTPPRTPTICQCNDVVYSLMSGCTYCQLGQTGPWADQTVWKDQCGEVWSEGLGFTESVVDIPAFAWRSWQNERWDPDQASSSASLYTTNTPIGPTSLSRAFPIPTSTTPISTSPTSPPSSTSQSVPNGSDPHSDSEGSSGQSKMSKWGPIIGGIAGGVILLLLLFWLLRHYLSSRKGKNRMTYPIASPAELPTSRSGNGGQSRSGTRSRGGSLRSFFQPNGGDRDMRRQTEMITHPMSFRDPRPAPKPTKGDSDGDNGYITTTNRLANRDRSDTLTSPGLIVMNAGDSSDDTTPIIMEPEPSRKGKRPPMTPSHDFSVPRPYSAQTLPSLYEPPTGAMTYRETTYSSYSPTATSPVSRSRYAPTLRDSSGMVGAALGSGRGRGGLRDARDSSGYWSRQSLPPVPRNVSDESGR